MGTPKYMKGQNKTPSSIVVSAEIFTNYIFKITANEKQFPKSLRYTLIKKFQNRCVSLCEHVYDGCNKKPLTKKDFKRAQKCQDEVYDDLAKLKALISIATSNARLSNYDYLATLFIDLTDAYRKWVRNVARAKSRALRNGTYEASDRAEKFKKNRLDKMARGMERDESGYIVLKRRQQSPDERPKLMLP